MLATPTYPGVYIREIPSGVHTIIGVATSITAFIGRTRRGPTDRPVRIQSFREFESTFGGLWADSTVSYAVHHFFLNRASDALIVRVHNSAQAASLAIGGVNLEAANEGDWGERLRVRIDYDTSNPTDTTLFNLTVRDMGSSTLETERFLNVSTDTNHGRFITRVLQLTSRLIRVVGAVPQQRPTANAVLPPGGDPFASGFATDFANNGDDGAAITDAQIIGPGLQAQQRGLWILEQADLFNLLCIPPLTRDIDVPNAVWNVASAYCSERRAVLIVDPPSTWDEPADVVGASTGLGTVITRTDSAAMYFPRIMAADPLKESRLESFAPCGAVAGVIARTDAERGVWKAPAGQDAAMFGVSALSLAGNPGLLTLPQIGILNPFGVNCLRSIPDTARVVWGARTLAGADNLASEWKYLPVRRLAYFLEESVFRSTQWAVFEPNDEPLWSQLRLNIGSFMQSLFRQGAFQGTSPAEAYFVKCSSETTTQTDIDSGIVNVLIGFAPLKPAEFVVIRIQQKTQEI